MTVRPGITSLSSIKYRNENEILSRSDNPEQYYIDVIMQDKLAIELDYLEKRSLLTDIKVIFQTIFGK